MTEAWGQDAEQAEADDDSPVAAADDYPADGGADTSEASDVVIAEDPLDEEMRATQQQLEILEKLILNNTCPLCCRS